MDVRASIQPSGISLAEFDIELGEMGTLEAIPNEANPVPGRWKGVRLASYAETVEQPGRHRRFRKDIPGRTVDHRHEVRPKESLNSHAAWGDGVVLLPDGGVASSSGGKGLVVRYPSLMDAVRGAITQIRASDSVNAYGVLQASDDGLNQAYLAILSLDGGTKVNLARPTFGAETSTLSNFHPDMKALVSGAGYRDLSQVGRDFTLLVSKTR